MRVVIAEHAGLCGWVKRAISAAEEYLAESQPPVYSTGPLIHNPLEVERLKNLGLIPSRAPWKLRRRRVVVASHGITADLQKHLENNENVILDLTCPNVKKIQRIASSHSARGYHVVIAGKKGHPEVKSIVSYSGGDCAVIGGGDNPVRIPPGKKVCVVSQTTISKKLFDDTAASIAARNPHTKIYGSVCPSVEFRIKAAMKLAEVSNLFVVIGGHNSSNTITLFTACLQINPNTVHVESPEELTRKMKTIPLSPKASIGITAGASTPQWLIDKVARLFPQPRNE